MNSTFFTDLLKQNNAMFFLIAGPCVVENEEMPMEIARHIQKITDRLGIPFIFKASYMKANRSRSDSFTGIGHEKALQLISRVGKELEIPVLTDIHTEEHAAMAAAYVDILQIPAFLCRQTELLIAAGKTGKVVNIKKGQFASAESMKYAVQKVLQTGNSQIMLTERGTTFGYNDLVVDFRNVPEMQANGVPVVVDITHSLQQPNQASGITGGRPELIETIAKAAIAVGCDGIFLETHPDPGNAKSDGANMLRIDYLEDLLEKLVRVRKAVY
jgi:2-dehydro-3-deoxyphosphooctonate aldolase (KDO 8-P synthase)